MFTVRNDDVSHDLPIKDFKAFCEVCDKYKVRIMQCVTPRGATIPIKKEWSNGIIKEVVGEGYLSDNKELFEYLKSRNDLIAVHGLYHTHLPTVDEIYNAKQMLENWGFKPTYYVPPFNEYNDIGTWGLEVNIMDLEKGERLEDYVSGMPRYGQTPPEFTYLHSWRFFPESEWYSLESLDRLLWRITNTH